MMKDLPVIIKSPADDREYSSFELDNDLRVVIIRDSEIKSDDEGHPVVAREACQSASDSSDCSSEDRCSNDVCIMIDFCVPIHAKSRI